MYWEVNSRAFFISKCDPNASCVIETCFSSSHIIWSAISTPQQSILNRRTQLRIFNVLIKKATFDLIHYILIHEQYYDHRDLILAYSSRFIVWYKWSHFCLPHFSSFNDMACLPSSLHSPITWPCLSQWQLALSPVAHVREALLSGKLYLLFSVWELFKKEPEASMWDAVLWQRHCCSVRAGSTRRSCSSTKTARMKWARTWRVLLEATLLLISAGTWWRTPRRWPPARRTHPPTRQRRAWGNRWSSAAHAPRLRTPPARLYRTATLAVATTRAECRITAVLRRAARSPLPPTRTSTWTPRLRETTSPRERSSPFIPPTPPDLTSQCPVTWTFL